MLRMLYRYENRYYTKIMSLCYLILAGTLLVGRLTYELFVYLEKSLPEDSDMLVLTSIPMSLVLMLAVLAVFAVLIIPQVLLAVRFWKNLIRDGGYLSLTLPVKPQAHVGCKIVTAFVWTVISALVSAAFVAAAVLLFNDKAVETIVEAYRALKNAGMYEMIIIFAALAVNGLLYALVTAVRTAFSMSMGQLTRKNKLLVAIGSWFGTGVAWNILSSMAYVVAMIPILSAEVSEEAAESVLTEMPILIANAAVSVIFIVVGWCVSNYVFRNKLNLE